MSSPLATSEVNLVDQYVHRKISSADFVYKVLCGALVAVVALRASDMLGSISAMVSDRVSEMVSIKYQEAVKIASDAGTLLALLGTFVFTARALK